VRNTLLATAVAAVLTLASAEAPAATGNTATKAELQALQSQLQALADRLSKVEAANATLKQENDQLKALADRREVETTELKAQTEDLTKQAATSKDELGKLKGADWASRIKFKGDFRVRDENITQDRVDTSVNPPKVDDAANRNRARFRARFGAEAKVTDTVKVGLRFVTGDGDPRSTNQTFTNVASQKEIWMDLAYADWKFMEGADLVLGKQAYPFWRPGQSMFYDGDFNPEGASVKFANGMFFGSAYGWWLTESYNSNPKGNNEDANIFGAQVGLKFELFGGETKLAAQYYDCGACKNNNPFWNGSNGSAYGNTTIAQGSTQVLKYGYSPIELSAEMGLKVFELPLAVWVDWAQNTASGVRYDTAYNIGAMLGKASNPGDWEAGVMYESMDKDALFAQMIDSDFANGNTDADGWVFKAGYAPVKNITLNATYFLNNLNKDVPVSGTNFTGLNYNRLQLDVNYKF
jgi:regulator of replication initiation timing